MDCIVALDGGVYLPRDLVRTAGFRPGEPVRVHIRQGQVLLARIPDPRLVTIAREPPVPVVDASVEAAH